MEDPLRRVPMLFLSIAGIFLFYGVFLFKIEVVGQEARVGIEQIDTDIEWDVLLEKQAMRGVRDRQPGEMSNGG